jgi:hypothetical protein
LIENNVFMSYTCASLCQLSLFPVVPLLWFLDPVLRRQSSVSCSYSYDGYESYPQAFEGIDPREADPVYVTLRDAARKRSDSGTSFKRQRKKRPNLPRRRCYSCSYVVCTQINHTNKPSLGNSDATQTQQL